MVGAVAGARDRYASGFISVAYLTMPMFSLAATKVRRVADIASSLLEASWRKIGLLYRREELLRDLRSSAIVCVEAVEGTDKGDSRNGVVDVEEQFTVRRCREMRNEFLAEAVLGFDLVRPGKFCCWNFAVVAKPARIVFGRTAAQFSQSVLIARVLVEVLRNVLAGCVPSDRNRCVAIGGYQRPCVITRSPNLGDRLEPICGPPTQDQLCRSISVGPSSGAWAIRLVRQEGRVRSLRTLVRCVTQRESSGSAMARGIRRRAWRYRDCCHRNNAASPESSSPRH